MGDLVDRDTAHLDLLTLLHYAAAGVTGLIACFPLIHVTIGALLAFTPNTLGHGKHAAPREVGLMFMGMGLAFVTIGWLFAGAHFFIARSLKHRRRFIPCVVLSCITCLACMFTSAVVSIPTLIILFRPGVKDSFQSP